MKRLLAVVALATALLLSGCAGTATGAPSASPSFVATGQPSSARTPSPAASDGTPSPGASGGTSGDASAQFGGDVCSALTSADIEGASYTQGKAVFDSTDTQIDAATGQAVVCQYLVTFNGSLAVGAATVSLMDAATFADHTAASVMDPEEAIPGIGSEAWLVAYAPGLYELWVHGTRGYFKVGAQSKASAIALATVAARRDESRDEGAPTGHAGPGRPVTAAEGDPSWTTCWSWW